MTQEEIIKKAYDIYPEDMGWWFDHTGYAEKTDLNAERREGYIKAFNDAQNEISLNSFYDGRKCAEQEYESLPKIRGWVARDKDGCLNFFHSTPLCLAPLRGEVSWVLPPNPMALNETDFPNLRWEDKPIEVELLIQKI